MNKKIKEIQNTIDHVFRESIEIKQKTLDENREKIAQSVMVILRALKKRGKILIFGNGGSAADSQHMAAEMIGRFQKERRPIAAIALTTDTSMVTALSNDYSFDIIFARQIQGLGCAQDVAIGLSTSGNSRNVIRGLQEAKNKGMKTIALTGGRGGKIAGVSQINMIVPSNNTARVQEAHICIVHIICELVEKFL